MATGILYPGEKGMDGQRTTERRAIPSSMLESEAPGTTRRWRNESGKPPSQAIFCSR